jgi:transposase
MKSTTYVRNCRTREDWHAARQSSSKALCKDLHEWLELERQRVPEGSATAKAIAYSLNRWDALTAYLDNGAVQIDNNHIENLVRPWAMGNGQKSLALRR